MAGRTVYLDIDASDLNQAIGRLRNAMKPKQFDQAMYGIFKRTGGHVRKILRQDLPHAYYVKASQINAAVKNPRMHSGIGGTGCTIPIQDRRGSIGGRYSASGGAHGWQSVHRKYRVKGRIVKAGQTTLPATMNSYGGQPPFRNLSSKKLGKATFTRVSADRDAKIRPVAGIAIPQMPMNRSQAEVQKDIHDYLAREIDRRFMALMRIGR